MGTGPLHRLCTQDPVVQIIWLQESQSEEKARVYICFALSHDV